MKALPALLLLGLAPAGALAEDLVGQVQDTAGRSVAQATVILSLGGRESRTETDSEGGFALPLAGDGQTVLYVEARGFRPHREAFPAQDPPRDLVVTLDPLAFREEVTVAASLREEGAGEGTASVAVLTPREILNTAAPALDDALRQVPGFTLFRRLGGRWANPTTQGPTLRGLGGSGAARALVLDDGVPLNDPFGGWVYWGRVPSGSLDQVEVRRGGGAHLFGSGAFAGVIQLVRPRAETRKASVELSGGTQRSYQAAGFFRGTQKGFSIDVSGAAFTTAGYILLNQQARGPIDQPSRSRHLAEELTVAHDWTGGTRVFVRGSMFREPRENGTPLQINDTEISQVVIGFDRLGTSGGLSVRGHLSSQIYDQVFSAVAPDRTSEQPTRDQRVEADRRGVSARFTRQGRSRRLIALGVELDRVAGLNIETPAGAEALAQSTDGQQSRQGAFVDLSLPIGALALSGGVRYDLWRNAADQSVGPATPTPLAAGSAKAWSPHGGAVLRLGSRLAFNASAYKAFRAPTLNELYRTFRVGDVVTQANAALDAERLSGREAGLVAALGALSVRAQVFRLVATDTVANVTLRVQPGLITRQRQNLGEIRSQGLEADAEVHGGPFVLAVGVLGADAEVTSFPADPTLEGKDLAQVPRRQLTVQARLEPSRGPRLAVQARWTTSQFEDDRNLLRLAPMRTVDATVGVPLGGSWDVFVAAENILNQRFEVARTPLLSLGPPRSVRAGVRLRVDSRPAAQPAPTVERH